MLKYIVTYSFVAVNRVRFKNSLVVSADDKQPEESVLDFVLAKARIDAANQVVKPMYDMVAIEDILGVE